MGGLIEEHRPAAVVIACNTASTLVLPPLREKFSTPFVGTVPAIKPAAEQTKTGVFGILATPGTVRRAYLDDLERQFAQGKVVIRRGSAGLVDIAERAIRGQPIDQEQVNYAVRPMFDGLQGQLIDIVVLACTHFPLIRESIQQACPPHVRLIDTGEPVARQAIRVAPKTPRPEGEAIAYVTGGAANRAAMSPALARFGYHAVEVVDL
jgi:glutamate racemase